MEAASATSQGHIFVHSLKYDECRRNIIVFLKEILNFICHTLGSQAFLSFSCICGLVVNLSICPCRKLQKITKVPKGSIFYILWCPCLWRPRLVLYICTFAYLRGQGLHCTGNLLFATNPGISQFLQSFNIYLASDWASRSCKSLEWYILKCRLKSENHIFKNTHVLSVMKQNHIYKYA